MAKLMLDALYPPTPDQLIADLNAVGADGVMMYLWRPGGTGSWTAAHVAKLRATGKLIVPIIVPPPSGGDINAMLQAVKASGFNGGPITLDLEPPNLPPAAWEEAFDLAARDNGFSDFDYGTPSNLGLYAPDDKEWVATWIRTGQLNPLPALPPGWAGWQFVNDVSINGTSYDASIIADSVFAGGTAVPIDQHLTMRQPVHGKVMIGAVWFDWGAASGGVLTQVGTPPAVGADVDYSEAVLFGGQWVDRINKNDGSPGDWGLLDSFVDTLDVSGCLNPQDCLAKQPAPQPPSAPTPPPPAPAPVVDQVARDALKAMRDALDKAGL